MWWNAWISYMGSIRYRMLIKIKLLFHRISLTNEQVIHRRRVTGPKPISRFVSDNTNPDRAWYMSHQWRQQRYPVLSIIMITKALLDIVVLWVSCIWCLSHNAIFLQCHIKKEEELHRRGNGREQYRGGGGELFSGLLIIKQKLREHHMWTRSIVLRQCLTTAHK